MDRFGVINTMSVVFVLVLGYVHLPVMESAKLPTDWGLCRKSDKGFDECLRKNTEHAIQSLKYEVPEFGIKTFDPLDIPELYIGEGKGPVNVAQHFKNVQLHGLTNVKLFESHIDFKNNILTARSVNPNLRLQGDYSMKGRILLLPIVGDGPCNVTLINTHINHTLVGEKFQKKGKEFMRFTSYTVTLRPEKVMFKFDNLFNGDKALGDNINKVLNENWDEVFTDVRAGYEKSFGQIFDSLANRIFPRVPLKDIFLD